MILISHENLYFSSDRTKEPDSLLCTLAECTTTANHLEIFHRYNRINRIEITISILLILYFTERYVFLLQSPICLFY